MMCNEIACLQLWIMNPDHTIAGLSPLPEQHHHYLNSITICMLLGALNSLAKHTAYNNNITEAFTIQPKPLLAT